MPGNSGKKGEQHGQGCQNTCTLLREALPETERSARCGDRPHPQHPKRPGAGSRQAEAADHVPDNRLPAVGSHGGKGEKKC